MYLREALDCANEIDPARPIVIGSLKLGEAAAALAAEILSGRVDLPVATLVEREFQRPVYWSVDHAIEGRAEIFGFPLDWKDDLPTALEMALVKAVAFFPPDKHDAILAGGVEIILGSESACVDFRKIACAAESPMVGQRTEFDGASSAVIVATGVGSGVRIAMNCLRNSYSTSPLKFRFLELYRVMEALFLGDVKTRLLAGFDAEPTLALNEALDALQSELKQITKLAEPHQDLFEECWTILDQLKNTNRFVGALFRRIDKKKLNGHGRWQTGAALIYQIRCAVVHAGDKDMILDNFPDADVALQAVLPTVERTALRMLGITLG